MDIKIYLLLLFCVKFASEVILTIAGENLDSLFKELGDESETEGQKITDASSKTSSDLQSSGSQQPFPNNSEEKELATGTVKQFLTKGDDSSQIILKADSVGTCVSDSKKNSGSRILVPDFKFGEPASLLRGEELYMYENPSEELILSIAIPTMKPEQQFNAIRRLSGSHYKGLPKAHQTERKNVNWCKVVASRDPEIMSKANIMYRMIQVDLISIIGGIGPSGSASSQGVSGNKLGSGWSQQHICEGLFLLNTYRGEGDCERVFIDLLARFHGQWGLFFKMFRQKFREICTEMGFSKGQWDVSNDRAYSQFTVLRSARKPIKVSQSKEKKEFIKLLRTRGGVCSLLTPSLREKASLLKASVDNIPQIKHISSRISLADYCDIILGKQSIVECADAIITFFKLKSETYFDSMERYRSIKPALLNVCSEVLYSEKDSKSKSEKDS
ncbi:signal peptide-containing protein [Cryptosporidium canis]|uniref:Signal peptide-containing protein n=1 Tax=Cryptosporidium canis TaxID=195482 RepID=A0A9D5HY07_9CRYT|nr:signal peptide-containing protein [Cryptosporidium canis]